MNCNNVERLLCCYFSGELDTNDRTAVENHLKNCASCAKKLEVIRQAAKATAAIQLKPVSNDFTASVLAQVRDKPRHFLFLPSHTGAVAIAACGLMLALIVFKKAPEQPGPLGTQNTADLHVAQSYNLLAGEEPAEVDDDRCLLSNCKSEVKASALTH